MAAGLAVTWLRLSHFRSHRAAQLDLDGRPVAIFGRNGAGKTNLIEAVSLLSPGRGVRMAAAEDLTRRPEGLGWKIVARLLAPDGAHEVETWSEGERRQVAVDGKPAPQAALGALLRILWLTPSMDRLWMDSAGGRRRFLDRMTLSLCPEHGAAVLGYDRALRERNRLLRDRIADPGWFEALEAQMAEFGAGMDANRRRALEKLAAARPSCAFPRADLELIGEGARDPEGMRAELRAGRARDQASGRSLIGPHRDDLEARYAAKGMAARLCSTGEQKALLISLILANAQAVAGDFGAPPILLLDEVAAHLDADRRAALFDEVCALGAQSWMTGTGPELFEVLGDRAQRLRVVDAGGESRLEWEGE